MLPDGEDRTNDLSGQPLTAGIGPASLEDARPRPRPRLLLAYLAAMVGGVVGIPAAVLQEMRTYSGLWLGAIVVAPLVEEIVKPIGVMFVMEKRFHWLRSRRQVVAMAALGALVFATLENLMFIHVYCPEAGAAFVAWRYIVCTALHVSATTIMGLGLARCWLRMKRRGEKFRIKGLLWPYLAAAGLHAGYNATALILVKTGVLSFD